jgi:hypothetical protein
LRSPADLFNRGIDSGAVVTQVHFTRFAAVANRNVFHRDVVASFTLHVFRDRALSFGAPSRQIRSRVSRFGFTSHQARLDQSPIAKVVARLSDRTRRTNSLLVKGMVMKASKQTWLVLVGMLMIAAAITYLQPSHSQAQPAAAAPDPAVLLGNCISTKIVTIKLEDQRGEPRLIAGRATFDRSVQAYWVSLVGYDLKFKGNTEKYINRQMISVDPFAKVIDGTHLEVSAKMGMRDGTGDWDDTYEGTITVAVTALMSSK